MHSSTFFQAFANRRFLAANMVALASLGFVVFFPYGSSTEAFLLALFSFVLLPIFFLWFLLREPVASFGISFGNQRIGKNIFVFFVALSVFSLFVWIVRSFLGSEFIPSMPTEARTSFVAFLSFVGSSALFNGMICFFFQGFLLSVWRDRFGISSVFFTTLLFAFFLVAQSSFLFERELVFFVGWFLISCGVAFVSKSVAWAFCFLVFSDILISTLLVSFL